MTPGTRKPAIPKTLLTVAYATLGALAARAPATRAIAAEAGETTVLRVRVYDGAASARALDAAIRSSSSLEDKIEDESLRTPVRNSEVSVDLFDLQPTGAASPPRPVKSWKAATDPSGLLVLDTGLKVARGKQAFVAHAVIDGKTVHSPFFAPQEKTTDGKEPGVFLYRTTEDPARMRVQRFSVVYDVQRPAGKPPRIRVRVALRLVNAGNEMYIGRKAGSSWREIWRLPLPAGAEIESNASPQGEGIGWHSSVDGRWLLIDAPIPGLPDWNRQGTWSVTYTIPASQVFVQTYPLPLAVGRQEMTVWASTGDIELTSAVLGLTDTTTMDPLTQEKHSYQVVFSNDALPAGGQVPVAVTVDNAAIGQISRSAKAWVWSFALVVLVALAFGLVLAEPSSCRKPPEQAVETGATKADSARDPPSDGPARLPDAARDLLQRIDELDAADRTQPAAIAERAHLLEALVRTLPREKKGR